MNLKFTGVMPHVDTWSNMIRACSRLRNKPVNESGILQHETLQEVTSERYV